MKKLMIAAAIVCAAAFAQAASISWSVSGVKPAQAGESTDNYWTYVFLTSDSSSQNTVYDIATIAAMITAGQDPYNSGITDGGFLSAAGFGSGEMAVTATGADKDSITMTAAAIVINADMVTEKNTPYQVVDLGTVEFVKPDAVMPTYGAAANNWQNVPEPTSGLLLLLGVAGLALRRRRA